MERLYAHKKSTFRFWDELLDDTKQTPYTADGGQLVAAAVEWLGIYSDIIPGIRPVDARLILNDWYTLWFYERNNVLL